MSELTKKQIRKQLSLYLAGTLEPPTFRDWFALALRDAHEATDPGVEELAHSIEWAFSDLERGVSAEQVRKSLLELAKESELATQTSSVELFPYVDFGPPLDPYNTMHVDYLTLSPAMLQFFPWSATGNNVPALPVEKVSKSLTALITQENPSTVV